METLNHLYATYKDRTNIFTLYLEEAHAEDEWPIGSSIKILAHKTIFDRAEAVNLLRKETGYAVPTILDNMKNEFNNLFKAWPIRFYIISDGILRWVAMPKDGMFSFADVENELVKYL